MKKCLDCKKEVSRKEYLRCNECNKHFRELHKKEHKCINCGKELNNFYAKRCKFCWYKFAIKENNPNHKHGNNCQDKKCIDCGNPIDIYSTRCRKCYGKIISEKLTGRIFTEDHRKKLSLAFKNKIVSLETRKKLSLSHGGTGIPYERRKYSLSFYMIRKKILKRDNHTCQLCNKKGNTVHHIDYNKTNDSEFNLITLCNKCNLKVNFRKDNWIKFFKEKIINILTKNRGITKNGTI